MADVWDAVFPYVAALLPTVAVSALFYVVIKSILEADRRERLAHSKWEKQSDTRPADNSRKSSDDAG